MTNTATAPAWDQLDNYSDDGISKSDVETAIDALGGQLDNKAFRCLSKTQLELIVSASIAKPGGQTDAEAQAIKAYQDARRRISFANAEPVTEQQFLGNAEDAPESMTDEEVARAMDYSGHTPAIDREIELGAFTMIAEGLAQLIRVSGENSKAHGFHDDWPERIDCFGNCSEEHKAEYRRAIVEKLALQHEEISESLGEIRSGRDALEIYFVDKKGLIGEAGKEYPQQRYGQPDGSTGLGGLSHPFNEGDVPLLKPEGFLVEQVDAVIRIADTAFLVHGQEEFIEAWFAKHEYNASREYKHGRKF